MQPLRFSWAMRELPGRSQPSQTPQVLDSPSSAPAVSTSLFPVFFFFFLTLYTFFFFLIGFKTVKKEIKILG